MKKFEFDEKNHIYKLYGLTIPSVSEIIEPLHKKIYENISDHSLEIAADRGTRAHRAIEFWNKYDFYNVDDDCKGYIEAYIKFRDEHPNWKVLNSELRTYHKNLLYGMTIDEVYQTPKGIVINDIKTTSQAHLDAWAVQLGGYRSGYESQHSSISGTTILQLFKGGRYIRSGETFKDESSQHYRMYIEGYNFMLKQIKEDCSKIFEKMFKEKLKQVRKVRILPLETQVFFYSLLTVVKDPTAKENVSQSLIVDIKKGLSGQDANFLNKKYAEVKLYEGTLKKALIKMFENRTIPAMYAWMNGNIYLDDKVVGIIKRKGCKMVAIREKDELIEIIGQCFRETVNSMPYLKK